MNFFLMLLTTVLVPAWYILPSRIISMTFKTSSKSITIKNDKLAEIFIAEKNTWGIATDPKKRNQISLLGVISYILFLPQIAFLIYHWWIYFKTGSCQWCKEELDYMWSVMLYYAIALSRKVKEGNKFNKGEIW